MSRFLFVAPPFTGHLNSAASVGRELELRGHEVAWAVFADHARLLLPSHTRLYRLDEPEEYRVIMRANRESTARTFDSVRFAIAESFAPLARLARPGVEAAVADFAADVVVSDQHAYAGAIAARRAGIPYATTAPTMAPYLRLWQDQFPGVVAWLQDQEGELEREAGLEPSGSPERSGQPVLLFTTPEFLGENDWPSHYRFVGPALEHRVEPSAFDWDVLEPGPRVLVSLGTVSVDRGRRLYEAVVDGLGDGPMQTILSAPPELVPPAPRRVVVRPSVPQLALLSHVDAVVCHAGLNTVLEALAFGLPVVVSPIWTDQYLVTRCVVEAGAGVRVHFGRVTASSLRAAVDEVLENPSYRRAAMRLQDAFRAAGGAPAAADLIEELAGQRRY
jgi:MGT family glycosyltransferase